jgi:hypothetical protein
MIRKSGYRFSEKIMLQQKAKAKYWFNLNTFRFSLSATKNTEAGASAGLPYPACLIVKRLRDDHS